MSEFLNIRIAKGMPNMADIDAAAERHCMNRTEFVMSAITALSAFDTQTIDRLKQFSRGFYMQPELMIQFLVEYAMASIDAQAKINGPNHVIYRHPNPPDFVYTTTGLLTGQPLYDFFVKEALERQRSLKKKEEQQ